MPCNMVLVQNDRVAASGKHLGVQNVGSPQYTVDLVQCPLPSVCALYSGDRFTLTSFGTIESAI